MAQQKIQLIFIDMYGTLLDMTNVENKVNDIFGNKNSYTIWYNLFMQYCFVDNCIEQFNEFDAIARATMQMTSKILRKDLSDFDMEKVLSSLKALPLHPEVQEGLSLLNDKSYTIVALTNSPEDIVLERMERTGLISYFKRVLSAEHVGKYKPYLGVYTWALERMQVMPEQALLVTSHGWDIAGAANAGIKTAYLLPSREIQYPLAPKPDYTCSSLLQLANLL